MHFVKVGPSRSKKLELICVPLGSLYSRKMLFLKTGQKYLKLVVGGSYEYYFKPKTKLPYPNLPMISLSKFVKRTIVDSSQMSTIPNGYFSETPGLSSSYSDVS